MLPRSGFCHYTRVTLHTVHATTLRFITRIYTHLRFTTVTLPLHTAFFHTRCVCTRCTLFTHAVATLYVLLRLRCGCTRLVYGLPLPVRSYGLLVAVLCRTVLQFPAVLLDYARLLHTASLHVTRTHRGYTHFGSALFWTTYIPLVGFFIWFMRSGCGSGCGCMHARARFLPGFWFPRLPFIACVLCGCATHRCGSVWFRLLPVLRSGLHYAVTCCGYLTTQLRLPGCSAVPLPHYRPLRFTFCTLLPTRAFVTVHYFTATFTLLLPAVLRLQFTRLRSVHTRLCTLRRYADYAVTFCGSRIAYVPALQFGCYTLPVRFSSHYRTFTNGCLPFVLTHAHTGCTTRTHCDTAVTVYVYAIRLRFRLHLYTFTTTVGLRTFTPPTFWFGSAYDFLPRLLYTRYRYRFTHCWVDLYTP